MTEEEILSMAQDQLEMACENLLNQKNKEGESYKLATWEVESCINALKTAEARAPQRSRQKPARENAKSHPNTMSMA
jgi:hypothetical protein